eukprot:6049447-Prymnesium_polylepis.1
MTTNFGSHCRRSDYAFHGVCHTGRSPNAQLQVLFETYLFRMQGRDAHPPHRSSRPFNGAR